MRGFCWLILTQHRIQAHNDEWVRDPLVALPRASVYRIFITVTEHEKFQLTGKRWIGMIPRVYIVHAEALVLLLKLSCAKWLSSMKNHSFQGAAFCTCSHSCWLTQQTDNNRNEWIKKGERKKGITKWHLLGEIKADSSDELSDGNRKGKCVHLATPSCRTRESYYSFFDKNPKKHNCQMQFMFFTPPCSTRHLCA